MGRKVLLYDADEKTYDWYAANRGLDMRPSKVDVSDPVVEPPEVTPPPWNGYGTEEDSLNSFFSLIPKRPRKDWAKIWAHDGQVCLAQCDRFSTALLHSVRRAGALLAIMLRCTNLHAAFFHELCLQRFLRSPLAGLALSCAPRGAPDGA